MNAAWDDIADSLSDASEHTVTDALELAVAPSLSPVFAPFPVFAPLLVQSFSLCVAPSLTSRLLCPWRFDADEPELLSLESSPSSSSSSSSE
eukprot:3073767-Pleurochrysis_carterae.AAC.1